MTGYIQDALRKLDHVKKDKPQYSPHEQFPVHYAKQDTTQCASVPDTSPTLASKDTQYTLSVVGILLYYTRALDGTLKPALNEISVQQSAPTEKKRYKNHYAF